MNPIPPGKYNVKVSLAGYRTTKITGFEIKNDKISFYDLILKTTTIEQDTIIPYQNPIIY